MVGSDACPLHYIDQKSHYPAKHVCNECGAPMDAMGRALGKNMLTLPTLGCIFCRHAAANGNALI